MSDREEPIDPEVEAWLQVCGEFFGCAEKARIDRIELEARELVAEFPELGERETAERVVVLASEIARSVGMAELADEPAMWRAIWRVMRRD